MKKQLLVGLILTFSCILNAQDMIIPGAYVPGEVLVQIDNSSNLNEVIADLKLVNGLPTELNIVKEVSRPVDIWLLSFDESVISHDEMLEALYTNKHILIAQNNHYVQERATTPNDPSFNNQWHHFQSNDKDIDSDLAWDVTTGGSTANGDVIVVCVIEGLGSDWDHPDLLANHWINTGEIDNNGIDDDGNGYIDDYHGWNSGSNDDNIGSNNHGTGVSGMIGARGNNNNNVAGINWDVKIMQVDMGSLSESNVIAAYTYPLVMRQMYNASGGTEGAFVVATNASWGIDNGNPASFPLWCNFYNTLGQNGILNCGATANANYNIDVTGDMPTGCSSPYMISVTNTTSSDVKATSAGYGQTTIDLGAPGTSVWTTSNGGGAGATSGTSFASPLTAGVIALLYSVPCTDLADLAISNPEAAANVVRTALLDGVDPIASMTTQTVTGGRLNANNSVQLILSGCGIPTCNAVVSSGSVAASCNGTCDGTVTVTATGGSGSFTYDIGSGPQASPTFTGLCAGPYSITVDDGDLCTIIENVTVTSPSPMGGGTALTHELMGNDGAINLSVSGGTAPYTYSWTGPSGFTANTQDLTGLTAGVYSVVVTDNNGCTFTVNNITITSSVGIIENGIAYSIYPNPANNEFTLQLPEGESLNLQLFDALGNLVLTQTANSTTTVGVSTLAKGIYVFTLTNLDGEQANGKLVIE